MKVQNLPIIENTKIAEQTYRLVLKGADTGDLKPGQFAQIRIPGFSLARPISLNEIGSDYIGFVYRIAGKGTAELSRIKEGTLSVITGCGNGFEITDDRQVLVIGGGIGCAPLMPLIRELKQRGYDTKVIFGFRDRTQTLFEKELQEIGVDPIFCYDEDGENTVMKMKESGMTDRYFYSCGPAVMMKYVCENSHADGQCSLESRMGCGFGACMGCSAEFKSGMARICKEGPVFGKEDILWQNLK